MIRGKFRAPPEIPRTGAPSGEWQGPGGTLEFSVPPAGPHDAFMQAALAEAAKARQAGEVPVGAVVVLDDAVVGTGFNQPIAPRDPTAHAEIVAIRAAAAAVGNYRLTGATLYVTVEPCLMCVGAMVHARIRLVVYGATEPKAGAIVSMTAAHELAGLNHRLEALGGVLEADSRDLLQEFFKSRRSDRRNGES